MSYILDALKRADAERARGTVPGLHAQSVATAAATPLASRSRFWLFMAGGLTLAAIAGGVALLRAPAGSERLNAAAPAGAKVAVSPAPLPLPAPAPQDATAVQRPHPDSPGTVSAPAMPTPKTPDTRVRPAGEARAEGPMPPAHSSGTTAVGLTRKPGAPAPLSPVAAPAVAKAPEDRAGGADAPLRSELPENIRREIPPLTITGAVDSANPAQRLLLVNGQILPQGGSPAAEVTLLEIKAQSSLFSFRGTRFRVIH